MSIAHASSRMPLRRSGVHHTAVQAITMAAIMPPTTPATSASRTAE